MTDLPRAVWRKSSRSSGQGACIELSNLGAVRDSKNPGGPALAGPVAVLVAAVKASRIVP
jgi:hypothetical protein